MASPELESLERKLLIRLQRNLPLVQFPFCCLAEELDLEEDQVMALIKTLKDKGLVRQISPVIDGRRLGYQSTLVASTVPVAFLRRAEAVLGEHPRISHAYVRNNEVNVWFTLSARAEAKTDQEIRELGEAMGATEAFSLPALRLFKIGAFFGIDGDSDDVTTGAGSEMPHAVAISDSQRRVVNVFQQDLPLVSSPFDDMANEAEMSVADFIAQCNSLIDCGVVRRFGASVNHRRAGYQGNGMACWEVPSGLVESAGQTLAAIKEVSHCYERRTNPRWRYNIFAMFHGGTQDSCLAVVSDAAQKLGMTDYQVLFSTREIRKTRVKYLA